MPLEGLLELVETLRARIDAHGTALRGSEALNALRADRPVAEGVRLGHIEP